MVLPRLKCPLFYVLITVWGCVALLWRMLPLSRADLVENTVEMAGLSLFHFRGLFVLILCPYIVTPTTTPLGSTQSTLGTTISSQICENDPSTNCNSLPQSCANCTFNSSCVYGDETTINCTAMLSVNCKVATFFLIWDYFM